MSFSRIKAIILQNILFIKHSLEEMIDTFFWPTMDLIVWGLMTVYISQMQGITTHVISFLIGGLILWNIVWRAQQDMSISFLRNSWSSSLINMFSSPLKTSEFIIGTMILGFIKILFTLALVSIIAIWLYSFNIFKLGIYFIPFFANLIVFAWIVGLVVTGLIVRFGIKIQALAWSLITVLHPLSAVFYPVAILPAALQKIALALPTAYIFEGMREVLASGTASWNYVLMAVILNIFYLIIASWFFGFMFKKAKQKGKLVRIAV